MKSIVNYQLETDKIINSLSAEVTPKLLLHSCCAPCSSYVLEYLSKYFEITVFYYNPNITPLEEYNQRANEQKRIIDSFTFVNKVQYFESDYDFHIFFKTVYGLECEEEGGKRCFKCYKLRLEKAAAYASIHDYPYFTTTLSISPHKKAKYINDIGLNLAQKYGVKFLPADFKKKDGYKRSIELSNIYNLYRQDYCGCVFSKLPRPN